MKINVGRINSSRTQIPFNLHKAIYCQGKKYTKKTPVEDNIGEILMGDRLFLSDYKLNTLKDEYCKTICEFNYDSYQERFLKFLIDNDYNATYYLDGLPASFVNFENNKVEYQGIPLGKRLTSNDYVLYNHLVFHIELQKEEDFSIEKTLSNLKIKGEKLFMNKDELGGGDISEIVSATLSSSDPDILNTVEDWIKKSEFSIRKFQITPFSIQHDMIQKKELTNEIDNKQDYDYTSEYNNLYKTNCFKKNYIIENIAFLKLFTSNETDKVEAGKNFNFTNFHSSYEGLNNITDVNLNSNSSINSSNEKVIENNTQIIINNSQNIHNISDYQNPLDRVAIEIDRDIFYPAINSKENIEYFRDSLLHNFYSPQAFINSNNSILLTYDIKFTISKKSPIYVSRWDHYLKLQGKVNSSIHTWSLINSAIGILFTSIVVMTIFLRVIRKDIDYIQLVSSENS